MPTRDWWYVRESRSTRSKPATARTSTDGALAEQPHIPQRDCPGSPIAADLASRPSRYPKRTAFIDADEPHAGREFTAALDRGYAIVLVSANGREHILTAQSRRPEQRSATASSWRAAADRLAARAPERSTFYRGIGHAVWMATSLSNREQKSLSSIALLIVARRTS